MLKKESFDCITCDVMMPEMDGFEFMKNLRGEELAKRTPVIMLTARVLEQDLLKGFALGVDDYVTKPFRRSELMARVQAMITNKRLRDDWHKNEIKDDEKIESHEEKIVREAEEFVIAQMDNDALKAGDLAEQMNYSQRQFERILKKLSGLSPNQFIKEIRMQKAYSLLTSRQFATVAEVRYAVGIPNTSYFSKIFQERFGIKPGELASGRKP